MANFPALYLNPTTGLPERLLVADGGLQIDVVAASTVNSAVELYKSLVTGGGGSFKLLESFAGNAACGAVGGSFSFLGGVNVAQAIDVTGASTLRGSATLGTSSADNFTVNSSLLGNLILKASANHEISCTSGQIKIYTFTDSDVWLSSAAVLKLDAATNIVATATTGSMSFIANTTGTVRAGAASDLTLGARGQNITLNQATAPTLSGFAGSITSLVGALNDLRGDVYETISTAKAGEGITAGSLICLDYDAGDGRVEVYLCDNTNTDKNRAAGIATTTVLAGADCPYITAGKYITNSVLAATNEGKYLFMAAGGLVTLTAPVTGTTVVVGILALGGAAGSSEMLFQPMIPTTSTP